jgi:hypothetical protein
MVYHDIFHDVPKSKITPSDHAMHGRWGHTEFFLKRRKNYFEHIRHFYSFGICLSNRVIFYVVQIKNWNNAWICYLFRDLRCNNSNFITSSRFNDALSSQNKVPLWISCSKKCDCCIYIDWTYLFISFYKGKC